MKCLKLLPLAVLAALSGSACNRKPPADAGHIAELELKAKQAVERQQELEQQLADQKIAAEREAMERERMQIEESRAELEQLQGDAATAAADQLRQREDALATREGQFERLQSTVDDEESALTQRDQQLDGGWGFGKWKG